MLRVAGLPWLCERKTTESGPLTLPEQGDGFGCAELWMMVLVTAHLM